MSNKPAPLLRPEKKVQTSIGELIIREMSWHDALEFLKALSAHSQHFLNSEGKFAFSLEKLGSLVTGAGELSDLMLRGSLGDEIKFGNLPLADGLLVLDAALEINLSPEVMALAKKTAGRFALVAGVRPAAPAPKTTHTHESSTSSSGRDGASPTS